MKKKILDYIKETRGELKKVTWPGRQYVTSATIVILVILFLVAFSVMFLDMGIAGVLVFLQKAF